LIWSGPRLRARRNAMIRIRSTLVGGDALPSSIPVKTPMLWQTARLLGTAVRFGTGQVGKYTEGQPTRISRNPNALRATLNIQKIEQTTRFSEAKVLIWSGPRLRARRNAMIRIRSTLVGGDALPSSIPVKTPMLWQTARLLGTAVRFGTGEVGKYTEGPKLAESQKLQLHLQVFSHLPHLRLLSRLWLQHVSQLWVTTRYMGHPNALRATLNIQEIE